MSEPTILVLFFFWFLFCSILCTSFVSFHILFYYYPPENYLFSNERQKGRDPDWRGGVKEPGVLERRKTVIRIYYVRLKGYSY